MKGADREVCALLLFWDKYRPNQLLALARGYMALEDWDKALSDINEVADRHLSASGAMSIFTNELEALRERAL